MPKTGQSRAKLCSLLSALFLAEKAKNSVCQSDSVCGMGRGFLDGFAIDMAAIGTPGVIRSRGFGGFDLVIEGFGVHDFSLADGLVEDGVR